MRFVPRFELVTVWDSRSSSGALRFVQFTLPRRDGNPMEESSPRVSGPKLWSVLLYPAQKEASVSRLLPHKIASSRGVFRQAGLQVSVHYR